MRDSKLETGGSMPHTADRPERRPTSLGERLPVLRRSTHRNDRGPWSWTGRPPWIRVSLVVAAVVLGALWVTGRLPWSDASASHPDRSLCADAFAAQRWREASMA